jgi:uncharacterized protein YcgI (DUF1989 family)
MNVEVTNEPTPPPRPSGTRIKAGCWIQLVDLEGKIVSDVITPDYIYENERRTRDERKY